MPDHRGPEEQGDWIVCLGETRVADAGWVSCPGAAFGLRRIVDCERCRLLSWRRDDRSVGGSCATGELRALPPMTG
jgi:hypothetical protein